MKKIKLLTSLSTLGALGGGVVAFATGCSCSSKKWDEPSIEITGDFTNVTFGGLSYPGGSAKQIFYNEGYLYCWLCRMFYRTCYHDNSNY